MTRTTTQPASVHVDPRNVTAHTTAAQINEWTYIRSASNTNFVADSNPARTRRAASALLQLPCQTYDIKVTFAAGKSHLV